MAGIYLHIPFCKRRCIYCDFYSTTMEQRKDEYIEALCRELEMRRDYTGEPSVATVYFGGGTPSQLEERHFHRVFETIGNNYRLRPDAEITLEANPDDLTPDYVAMLRRLPFNRISIGIQTFNDETLRLLHRRHTASQAVEAVRRCQKAGFGNISIDLMYGLPGESRDSWANDLQQAIGLQVQHISAYHLIYEEGTELWELRRRHRVEEVDEDSSLTFFSMLIDRLREIPQIKEVRGKGLMIGLEFDQPVKELRHKLLFEQHVFTGASGTNVIRLLPPLSLSQEQADCFIGKLKNILP